MPWSLEDFAVGLKLVMFQHVCVSLYQFHDVLRLEGLMRVGTARHARDVEAAVCKQVMVTLLRGERLKRCASRAMTAVPAPSDSWRNR